MTTRHLQGVTNFKTVSADPRCRAAIGTGLLFAALSTSGKLLLGGLVAAALSFSRVRSSYMLFVAMIPLALPGTLIAIMWQWMFYDVGGFANSLLACFGLIRQPVAWLGHGSTAFYVMVGAAVWRAWGLFLLLFVLGARAIPRGIREAALLDGATGLRYMTSITLPFVRPLLISILILSCLLDLGEFDTTFGLTRGGPGYATHTAVTYAYELGLIGTQFSLAIALALTVAPFVAGGILCIALADDRAERAWKGW
ncbi:MAG: sugar ABC transporter permease [Acidobacteriota bacterium]